MTAKITTTDSYLDKIHKLIPAEVTGAFIAIHSTIPGFTNVAWVLAIAGVLMVACFLYARFFRGVTSLKHLIFVTFVAYPIWIFSLIEYRLEWASDPSIAFIPAALVVLATVFAPFFVGTSDDG